MKKRQKYPYCWRTRLKAEENMEVLFLCSVHIYGGTSLGQSKVEGEGLQRWKNIVLEAVVAEGEEFKSFFVRRRR